MATMSDPVTSAILSYHAGVTVRVRENQDLVRAYLKDHAAAEFADAFIKHGIDSLADLKDTDLVHMEMLTSSIGMTPEGAKTLIGSIRAKEKWKGALAKFTMTKRLQAVAATTKPSPPEGGASVAATEAKDDDKEDQATPPSRRFSALSDSERRESLSAPDVNPRQQAELLLDLQTAEEVADCLASLSAAAAAVVALELRLSGSCLDAVGALDEGAGASIKAEVASGAGAKILKTLHKKMPKDTGAKLLACTSTKEVATLVGSLNSPHGAALLGAFAARSAAGPILDEIPAYTAAALILQVGRRLG